MQATVFYSAVGNEKDWRPDKYKPSLKSCWIVVEIDGKKYDLPVREDQDAWTAAKGEQIAVEITAEPSAGKYGRAKIPGSGFKGFGQKPFTIPDTETASKAADFAVLVFKAVKGRLPDYTDEVAATLAAAIFNRTT